MKFLKRLSVAFLVALPPCPFLSLFLPPPSSSLLLPFFPSSSFLLLSLLLPPPPSSPPSFPNFGSWNVMQDFHAETHFGRFRNLPAFVATALFLKLETKAGTSHLFLLLLFVFYRCPTFKRIFFFIFILLYLRAFGALGLWILFG